MRDTSDGNGDAAAGLARHGLAVLDKGLLVVGDRWGGAELLAAHRKHQSAVLEHLRGAPGFARSMLAFHTRCLMHLHGATSFDHFGVALNFLSFLQQVRCEYAEIVPASDAGQVDASADAAMVLVTTELLARVHGQVTVLKRLIELVQEEVSAVEDVHRVVFIELPVGNSLPVRLLERAFGSKKLTATVRIALTRNDSASKGITRDQLIQKRLLAEVNAGDIVVYVDEWISGSNFDNVSQLIWKSVQQRGAKLLPIALLAPGANRHERWRSHAARHDGLAQKAGATKTGPDLRLPVPAVSPTNGLGSPFFWSEFDRLAGYRKLQPLGAAFSSLDRAVETLASDKMAREQAFNLLLNEYAGRRPKGVRRFIGPSWARLVLSIGRFSKRLPDGAGRPLLRATYRLLPLKMKLLMEMERKFQEGLVLYCSKRDQLRTIYHVSNTDVVDDLEAAIVEVSHAIADVLGDSLAMKSCVGIAVWYDRLVGDIDPADRYYFKHHVPVVADLEACEGCLHAIFMRQLASAVGLEAD